MSKHEAVAVRDDEGRIGWFHRSDAHCWKGIGILESYLFRIGDRWALFEPVIDPATEARFIDDTAALRWLTKNGFAPPAELAAIAEQCRLR